MRARRNVEKKRSSLRIHSLNHFPVLNQTLQGCQGPLTVRATRTVQALALQASLAALRAIDIFEKIVGPFFVLASRATLLAFEARLAVCGAILLGYVSLARAWFGF